MDTASQEKCARVPHTENSNRQATQPKNSILRSFALLAVTMVLLYGLYLLNALVMEFKNLNAKLDKVSTIATDISRLSGKISSINETNQGLKRMEKYMRYLPVMAKNGSEALTESRAINHELQITNTRLLATSERMSGAASGLTGVSKGLAGMQNDMGHMRTSVDKMAASLPAIGVMQDILVSTNSTLDKTAASVGDVTSGINNIGISLDDMRALMKEMNSQFSLLPEIKQSFDSTNDQITTALSALGPIKEDIPKFTASLQEMNQISHEMNQTTKEMAASLKKTNKRGTLGIALLTAAGFAH